MTTHPAPSSREPAWADYAVLVVDDEAGVRNFLQRALQARGCRVDIAGSAEEGAERLVEHHFDAIVLDIALPGRSGMDWLRSLKNGGFAGDVILITAFADIETAIDALRAGASDFVLKPFRVAQILNAVQQGMNRSQLARENWLLRHRLAQQPRELPEFVGRSPAMRALIDALARVAPVNAPVLLCGESGTGKELAAQTLHRGSARSGAPFVRLHCTGLSAEALESELFGHAPGAFADAIPGADQARDGLFHYAQGGTLFLDEISELPLPVQASLLRVIEERQMRPAGSRQKIPVDVRLVAASERDLAAEVAAGRFRKDLYYRLQVVEIALPPLREHRGDLGLLFEHFVALLAPQLGAAPLRLDADELRGRPRGGQAGHRMLRDADRLEILRQSARCGPRYAVRRRILRLRLEPCAGKGRPMGCAVLAESACSNRQNREPDRPGALGAFWPPLLLPP